VYKEIAELKKHRTPFTAITVKFEEARSVKAPVFSYLLIDQDVFYQNKRQDKYNAAKYYVKGDIYTNWTLLYESSTAFANDDILRVAMFHHSQPMNIHSVNVKHASRFRGATLGVIADVATCSGDFNTWESLYNDNGPVTLSTNNFADPDTLVLTVLSDTSVGLSWNSNTTDESGFKLERCVDTGSGCSFVQFDLTGNGVTSYTDTSAPSSATVSYRVKAYKTTAGCNWTSGPSNEPSVVLAAGAPSGLDVTALNSFMIRLLLALSFIIENF